MTEFSFYAVHPKITAPDCFYKIYVSRDGLLGAWLAGDIYVWRVILASLLWQVSGRSVAFLLASKATTDREACYDRLISQSGQWLERDPRNFAVPRSLICNATQLQPTSPGLFGGSLRLQMNDSSSLWLKILKPATSEGVIEQLGNLGYFRGAFAPSAIPGSYDDNPYRSPRFER